MKCATIAIALLSALILTACGGGGSDGGGNIKPGAPPPEPPSCEVTNNCDDGEDEDDTPPPPAGPTCDDPRAANHGGQGACSFTYTNYKDNLLVPTNVALAQSEGFTGKGVKVGLLDSQQIDGFAPLESKAKVYTDFTDDPADDPTADGTGHGPAVGSVLAGNATATFKGGAAPDVDLYWGRVCHDNSCAYSDIGKAIETFAKEGVRLFNVSIGGHGDEDKAEGVEHWMSGSGALIDQDALVVASTGNDTSTEAHLPAALPHYFPEYAGHFIAAANVAVNADGSVNALYENSNHCGLAAKWCVSAPGYIDIDAVPNSDFDGGGVAVGTSFSAPIITGTAAMVWQAFPWMSASNVQQSVLTTATDLGDAGVDSVFGWGLLNAAKAVKGPGQLVGDFEADVTLGFDSDFANDITGKGSLTKMGAGALTLTGANTYAGGTHVNAGTLALTGSLSSDLDVATGATFASLGGTIDGSYAAAADSTTAVQIGTGLDVTGSAALDGTLNLLAPKADYIVAGTETVLTAGTVTGTFTEVTYGNEFFWDAKLVYGTDAVQAELTRTSGAVSAATAGMSAAVIDGAGQADALVSAIDGRVALGDTVGYADVIGATAGLLGTASPGVAALALESLTGQIHVTANTLSFQQVFGDQRLLSDRVNQLDSVNDGGAWVQAYAINGDLRRSGYAKADYSQDGLMIGADNFLTATLVVGASLANSDNKAHLDAIGGHSRGSSTSVSLYARQQLGYAYLSGVVGYSDINADTERTVIAGSTAEQISSSHDNTAWHARIEAGYDFNNGLTPFVAVGSARVKQGAINEIGASGLGLSADEASHNAGFADLGLRYGVDFARSNFGVDVTVRHVFNGDELSFDAWFTGMEEAAFTVTGQPLPDDSARLGIHYRYNVSHNATLFFDAANEWATGQSGSLYGNVGIRVGF